MGYRAVTARPDCSTVGHDGGADRVVADAKLRANLDQGEATCIPARCFLTEQLRKRRLSGFEPGTPCDLTHGAAMDLEALGELSDWHSIGVLGEQFGSIRGTQARLSLSRIFADRAALIGDLGGS